MIGLETKESDQIVLSEAYHTPWEAGFGESLDIEIKDVHKNEEVKDQSLSTLQRLNLGFGETPFRYEVRADDEDTETAPSLNSENIGSWLGYESLIPASSGPGEFINHGDFNFDEEGNIENAGDDDDDE
jgi:hypothetical protein